MAGEKMNFGGASGEKQRSSAETTAEKRRQQEELLGKDVQKALDDEDKARRARAVEAYGKEEAERLEQVREGLMQKIEGLRRYQYRDSRAKEKNDKRILSSIRKLNEVLDKLGEPGWELEAKSMPLKDSEEDKQIKAEQAEEARRAALTEEERAAEDAAKAEAEKKAAAERAKAEEAERKAAEEKLTRDRQLKEKMATWLVDDTKDLETVVEMPEDHWVKEVDPETGKVTHRSTRPDRKEFFEVVDGKMQRIADPTRLRDGQIVTDEDGNKLIYRLIKDKKTGKVKETYIDAAPDDDDTPEEYAEFVREARKRHAEAVGLKEEELTEGEVDQAELERRREEYRDMLMNAKDRMGNRMFSEATIKNIVENYDGKGMMLNPVEAERRKALEMARDAQRQSEREEAERILNGRDVKTYARQAKADMEKLQKEIAELSGKEPEVTDGVGFRGRITTIGRDPKAEKQANEARRELLSMRRKFRFVTRIMMEKEWDEQKDGKWFGMANLDDIDLISPDPEKVKAEQAARAEQEREAGEAEENPEIVVDLSSAAAGGEADFNSPERITLDELKQATAEAAFKFAHMAYAIRSRINK